MSDTPDPWAAQAAAAPLAAPLEFDGQQYFEEAFRRAVAETVDMQAVAWAALVQRFGSASALQLAPVLLPPLLEGASQQALLETKQAADVHQMKLASRALADFPNGQPW